MIMVRAFTPLRGALVAVLWFVGICFQAEAATTKASSDGVWTLQSGLRIERQSTKLASSEPGSQPRRFQAAQLHPAVLEMTLAAAPMERDEPDGGIEIELPTPDGEFERFAIVESPVVHADLERWLEDRGWPVRTYRGRSLDHAGSAVRLDWGRGGFHAFVTRADGSYFIDPATDPNGSKQYGNSDRPIYLSYFKRDAARAHGEPFTCGTKPTSKSPLLLEKLIHGLEGRGAKGASSGGELATYRTAVALTGDFTTRLFGGDAAAAQAGLVTIMNRVNLVFERELSVRFSLVADNNLLTYTDENTDPYSQPHQITMINENQPNIDSVIGTANYDIGHVLFWGSGGVVFQGFACSSSKAQATSGFRRAGDGSLSIDTFLHELGHQLDADHSFNSANQFCTPERTAVSAYEVGSGSTIMSYGGLCGEDNLVLTRDHYFHAHSLAQMRAYKPGSGACALITASGNDNAPTVSALGDGLTIPAATPFELLTLDSGDADGDSLTYTWDQLDLGAAAGLADGDTGSGPLVRSLAASSTPDREITGTNNGEILPTTNRGLTFRVTVRDNHSGGGRIGDDTIVLTSDASAGPFRVTAPDGGEQIPGGNVLDVTWDVAGTDAGDIQTSHVDILLSTDGGQSFPTVLSEQTPNDGMESVTLPSLSTASARIRVQGSGHLFFDVSDADFAIGAETICSNPNLPLGTTQNAFVSDDLVVGSARTISDLDLSVDISHEIIADTIVRLLHLDTGRSVTLIHWPGTNNIYSADFGCGGDDIVATLDDEAPFPAEDQCGVSPAIDGVFSPTEPLYLFDGESLSGTWRLEVGTSYTTGGTLNQWCLKASGTLSLVGVNDNYIVDENGSVEIAAPGVLTNDVSDTGSPLSVASTGLATAQGIGGSATVYADGRIEYTPPSNAVGQASVAYTVADNLGNQASALAIFTVSNVDDPPAAADDSLSAILEDSSDRVIAKAALTANDSAGINDAADFVTIVGVSDPVGGQVAMDDSVTFSPAADFFGMASFVYTVEDEAGTQSSAAVNFPVAGVNDAPSISLSGNLTYRSDDVGEHVVPGFLQVLDMGPGEADQNIQSISVNPVSDANHLVDSVSIDSSGQLEVTLSGQAGAATFDVSLTDDGGTANGGVDTSTAERFILVVEELSLFADGFEEVLD